MLNDKTSDAVKVTEQQHVKATGHDTFRRIEHPGYEPYVKVVCSICLTEAYVKRVPDEE